MRAKDAVGVHGERLAVDHLQAAGLTVLQRNWRCRDGELDIIATEGDTLVICEVKTRSSLLFGHPAEAVAGAKAARIRRLAARWLAEQDTGWPVVRFDVVGVLRPHTGPPSVTHLRGAF